MAPGAQDDQQLTSTELADLLAAIDDEYKARATYAQVLADFGENLPFSNIVDAEQRYIDALVALFARYGLDVPPDPWPGQVTRYGTIVDACADGVRAEIDNAALYDRLLAGTTRDDLVDTYRNLQQASQENHLPAFRRCAERGGPGWGRGGGGWRGGGGRPPLW